MKYRVASGFVLLLAVCGFVLIAKRPDGLAWRIDLLQQKARGEHLGLSWAEVGVRMFPGSLGVRRFLDPGPDHWFKKLDYPLEQENAWKIYHLFAEKTSCMDSFDAHVSVLQAGVVPHELHQHPEEEIIIPISGEVDILRARDGTGADQTIERIDPGRFVYHAPRHFHTIRAVGPHPSSYLVFKWSSTASKAGREPTLASSTFEYGANGSALTGAAGFQMKILFESPTVYLDKLHSHYSTMQPGAGYEPHDDAHDVAIFVFDGALETIGAQVSAPAVIFYSARKPHGMRNRADAPARYLVFEFHGCGTKEAS